MEAVSSDVGFRRPAQLPTSGFNVADLKVAQVFDSARPALVSGTARCSVGLDEEIDGGLIDGVGNCGGLEDDEDDSARGWRCDTRVVLSNLPFGPVVGRLGREEKALTSSRCLFPPL